MNSKTVGGTFPASFWLSFQDKGMHTIALFFIPALEGGEFI